MKSDTATHEFGCRVAGCGFVSSGWPTKSAAVRRGAEHKREHETGDPAPELANSEATA